MKTSTALCTAFVFAAMMMYAKAAVAQDPVKVAPEKFKVILENDKVRVLDVRLKAGEKTGVHSHPDHIVYSLSDVKLKTTLADAKVRESEFKSGDARWSEAVTHDNENVGTTDTHALVIEIKPAMKKK